MSTSLSFYTNVSRLGNHILVSGYDSQTGEKVFKKETFSPSLYIKTASPEKFSGYSTIKNEPLQQLSFETMAEASNFIKQSSGTNLEIYGNQNFVFQWIAEQFPDEIQGIDSSRINVCIFDLEMISETEEGFPHASEAKFPIVSGAFYFSKTNEYILLGLKDGYVPPDEKTRYIKCNSEIELLGKIISLLSAHSPDVITGWNISLFDIPYLINRIEKVLGPGQSKRLSPWNRIVERKIVVQGKENIAFDIVGIAQLDYLDLFKKFSVITYGQLENYRLGTVANAVLGEQKEDYSEYGSLKELYAKNFQKFISYNKTDISLIKGIDEQIHYIDIAMMLSLKAGTNFIDTMGTIKIWDTYIYRELLKRNQVVPPNKYNREDSTFEGAYVKEPIPGMYEWVVTFDLASLYPNIIVEYNLSPETIIENEFKYMPNGIQDILDKNVQNEKSDKWIMAANGVYFDKSKQGILPEIVERLFQERVEIKREMLDAQKQYEIEKDPEKRKALKNKIDITKNKQISIKTFLNSLFGACGSPSFRFFDKRIAEAITLTGQLTIKWAGNVLNTYLNKLWRNENLEDYIITGDTDSIFLDLSRFIKEFSPASPIDFLDKLGKTTLNPLLAKGFDELFSVMGGYKLRASMKREKICLRGIFLGKKRYVVNVLDNEGVRYSEPKIAITGIEAIKSSTPGVIRQKLKDSFRIIMDGDKEKTEQFITSCHDEFLQYSPEQIAFPRGVSKVKELMDPKTLYKKGCPINSRAAILFNHWIDKLELQNRYPKIQSSDKILYLHLKMPNPIRENVMGFLDRFPKEFQLDEYIDYETQFEKTFLSVLVPILEKIGWKDVISNSMLLGGESLDDFFA